MSLGFEVDVHAAVARVDDPEYPGISIVDLGLLESIEVRTDASGSVQARVGLIPTFSGCPALDMIANDVEQQVASLPQVDTAEVVWLNAPVWNIDRVSTHARSELARTFTVAVDLGRSKVASASCPRCGAPTSEQSMFGPSKCRSVHRCSGCGETVEVLRG